MSFGDTFENDLLKLIFNAVAIANIADNAAVSPLTQLWLSLLTADPGESGNQTTNEITSAGYARVSLVRTASGWVVTGNSVSPAADTDFPEITAGAETATHVGFGTASSGTGKLIGSGALTPNIPIAAGTIPRIKTTSTITLD